MLFCNYCGSALEIHGSVAVGCSCEKSIESDRIGKAIRENWQRERADRINEYSKTQRKNRNKT